LVIRIVLEWTAVTEIFNREVETRCVRFFKQLETVCFMGNCCVLALMVRLFDNTKGLAKGWRGNGHHKDLAELMQIAI